MTDPLDIFIQCAESLDGLNAETDPAAFGQAMAPHGPADVQHEFTIANAPNNRNSSCKDTSLHVAALFLEAMGFPGLVQSKPWTPNDWPAFEALARPRGALHVPTPTGAQIRPGCIMRNENAGGRHWRNVIRDLGGGRFESIDGGGKTPSGHQLIHRATFELRGSAFDVTSGRPVANWIDMLELVDALQRERASQDPKADAAAVTPPPIDGIDVSQFNGPVDWQRVAAAGIRFVYVRALIGRDTHDSMLHEHCNGARAAGLDVGLYLLLYPRHRAPQDAEEQGRQLAELHEETGATLVPMLDCEDGPPGPPTGCEWRDAINGATRGAEAENGCTPGVYGSPAFFALYPEIAHAVDASTKLWLAAYVPTMPATPRGFSAVTMWQYASSAPGFTGHVDGVRGACDRSRLLVPIETLRV